MRARYYHPKIRRFVNQNILLGNIWEGQTLNRFAFVTGNPVSFIDPWGLLGTTTDDREGFTDNNSTIQGDGQGGIVVVFSKNLPQRGGLKRCVKVHENVHKRYVETNAPKICQGEKKGTRIIFSPLERLETECVAVKTEVECL